MLSEHGDGSESRFVKQSLRFGRFPVNELGAELHWHARVRAVKREDSTTDAFARLEHQHLPACAPELTRGHQPGGTGTDDYRVKGHTQQRPSLNPGFAIAARTWSGELCLT